MIFVDTSFWVAMRNRRDSHHEQAQRREALAFDGAFKAAGFVELRD